MAKVKNNNSNLTNGQFGTQIKSFEDLIKKCEEGIIPEGITVNQHPMLKQELDLTGSFSFKADKDKHIKLILKLDEGCLFANSQKSQTNYGKTVEWDQVEIEHTTCVLHQEDAKTLIEKGELVIYEEGYFTLKTKSLYCDLSKYFDGTQIMTTGILTSLTLAEKSIKMKQHYRDAKDAREQDAFKDFVNKNKKK